MKRLNRTGGGLNAQALKTLKFCTYKQRGGVSGRPAVGVYLDDKELAEIESMPAGGVVFRAVNSRGSRYLDAGRDTCGRCASET